MPPQNDSRLQALAVRRRVAGRSEGLAAERITASAAKPRPASPAAICTNKLDDGWAVPRDTSTTDEAAASPPTFTEAAIRAAGPKVAAVPMAPLGPAAATRLVGLAGVRKLLCLFALVWLLPRALAATDNSSVANAKTGRALSEAPSPPPHPPPPPSTPSKPMRPPSPRGTIMVLRASLLLLFATASLLQARSSIRPSSAHVCAWSAPPRPPPQPPLLGACGRSAGPRRTALSCSPGRPSSAARPAFFVPPRVCWG